MGQARIDCFTEGCNEVLEEIAVHENNDAVGQAEARRKPSNR